MPSGGPVYQPTTASYEEQNQWAGPGGFLNQHGTLARSKIIQWVALILGLGAVAAGLIMIIEGGMDISDTRQHDADMGGGPTPVEEQSNKADVVVIVIGVLLLLVGLGLLAFYLTLTFRRRGCPCFMTKEQRMARALRSPQSVNGQGMNPSTDLLVAAQYAPVSEIAFQPPTLSEEEETRKLMGSDNKDCSSDDSERMLDKDPRIVLRPLSKVEESQDSEGAY